MSVSFFKISYQVLEPKVQVCYPCPVVLSMVDLGAIRLVFVVGPQYCLFWALKILFESGLCSDLVSIDPQPTLLEAKQIIKSVLSYAYCIATIIQITKKVTFGSSCRLCSYHMNNFQFDLIDRPCDRHDPAF